MRCFKIVTWLTIMSVAVPVCAGELSKTWSFELDKWYDLNVTDGPVTLHKLRIEKQSGGLTKSKLFRPTNSDNLQTIQIQIEYSNSSRNDWEAHLDIKWVDSAGVLIDGYRDEEGINDDESYERMTVTLSTLKYGLKKAKKLKVSIKFERD